MVSVETLRVGATHHPSVTGTSVFVQMAAFNELLSLNVSYVLPLLPLKTPLGLS